MKEKQQITKNAKIVVAAKSETSERRKVADTRSHVNFKRSDLGFLHRRSAMSSQRQLTYFFPTFRRLHCNNMLENFHAYFPLLHSI